MRGHWQHLDIYRDFYFLPFFAPLSFLLQEFLVPSMLQWMQHSQGGAWAVDVMYVPSQLLGPVQAGKTQQCQGTAFFTPFHLVLGDYLALMNYCVIVKLWHLDIISSVIIKWSERVKCSECFSGWNCPLGLYRRADSMDWIFQTVQCCFYFDSFFERWINKVWFLQRSLQLPLKLSSLTL